MGHFIEMEQRYLNGDNTEPESESFLEPEKITPSKFDNLIVRFHVVYIVAIFVKLF